MQGRGKSWLGEQVLGGRRGGLLEVEGQHVSTSCCPEHAREGMSARVVVIRATGLSVVIPSRAAVQCRPCIHACR